MSGASSTPIRVLSLKVSTSFGPNSLMGLHLFHLQYRTVGGVSEGAVARASSLSSCLTFFSSHFEVPIQSVSLITLIIYIFVGLKKNI